VLHGPHRALIERVVDGDTGDVMVSLEFDEYAWKMVRIKGTP
jgi:hypothetical protein